MVWLRPDLSTGDVPLKPVSILDVGDSATAVDLPSVICYPDRYLIAVGLESGEILLYTWKLTDKGSNSEWIQIIHLDQQYAHHLTVKRLRFRPVLEQNNKTLQLASGGADHSVKIYNIQIDTITL